MKVSKRKILLFSYIFFVSLLTVSLIFIAILGNKERKGYIEILNKTDNVYGIRISYHDKIFRNSDIYEVYVDNSSLPQEFRNIEWGQAGSPFANIISDKKISIGEKIDSISYKLRVKKSVYSYALLITIIFSFFVFLQNMLSISINKPSLYIIFISILGFIFYCYRYSSYWIHWDSNYVFNRYVLNSHSPDNWMGWFYPYIWSFLYNIFHTKNIIAVFQNFLFWLSMPIIYLCLFEKKKTSYTMLCSI